METQVPKHEDEPGQEAARPNPHATFSLAPGVRLEPLGDGSAVLYSRDLDQSLSLNHTAALLCSFADGQHTVANVLQEMSQIFPGDPFDERPLLDFLRELEARQFLQWT
jgi:hypothetical protein